MSALALMTLALFHRLSAAAVMLAKLLMFKLVLTKYSLPTSLLRA